MSDFFVMSCYENFEDYVSIVEGQFSPSFIEACSRSEFQFLDRSVLRINILENGGTFPDFMYLENASIPLISMRLRKLFLKLGVDNLFYKQVDLVEESLGIDETYYLALPPRIRCLDMDKSSIDFLNRAEPIYIDSNRVGNYQVFKLDEVLNDDIIVTTELKNHIERLNAKGMLFFPTA